MKSSLLKMLISKGESINLDFKFEIADAKKIAKTFVAFANTKGGKLLIGVDDMGAIAGIQSEEELFMANISSKNFCRPPVPFTSKEWNSDGKVVLEIAIQEGAKKPYFAPDENGNWNVFVRVHDKNLLAEDVFVQAWKKKNGNETIQISFSGSEKLLLDFLTSHPSITVMGFVELAGIKKQESEEIISDLVAMDILTMDYSEGVVSLSINPEIMAL